MSSINIPPICYAEPLTVTPICINPPASKSRSITVRGRTTPFVLNAGPTHPPTATLVRHDILYLIPFLPVICDYASPRNSPGGTGPFSKNEELLKTNQIFKEKPHVKELAEV